MVRLEFSSPGSGAPPHSGTGSCAAQRVTALFLASDFPTLQDYIPMSRAMHPTTAPDLRDVTQILCGSGKNITIPTDVISLR